MADHTWGREVLRGAWLATFGREPTTRELQAVAAVSIGESPYGMGVFKLLDHETGETIGTTSGTNNWGAIQAGHDAPCAADAFEATDSRPNADGTSTYYNRCFRRWETPELGAAAYLRTLLTGKRASVAEAVSHGTAQDIAEAMHATRYYEGVGATVEKRIARYASGIENHGKAIAAHFGEPYMLGTGGASGAAKDSGMMIAAIAAVAIGFLLVRRG